MFVCLCKGITDRQVEAAIEEGATTLGKLRKSLGVATQCGKCGITTKEILSDYLTASADAGPAPFYAAA